LHRAELFLRRIPFLTKSRNPLHFMEPEVITAYTNHRHLSPILSQINSVHVPKFHFLNIHFNIINIGLRLY
jgi:hypothetical protein